MGKRRCRMALAWAAVLTLSAIVCSAATQAQVGMKAREEKEAVMTNKAGGTFDVTLRPQKADSQEAESAGLNRMSISKKFHGTLEAASTGEMLSVTTNVKGSAGYVAQERVSGKLNGRAGTFVLQHSGIMSRGAAQLDLVVVPDSGTDQLAGLSGTMTILIDGGQHLYDFRYSLPADH